MDVFAVAILGKSRFLGSNAYRTHPEMLRVMPSGIEVCYSHAETSCLGKVPRQSRHKLSLFVFRLTKDGALTMARPCRLCQLYLLKEGLDLRRVLYTDWHGCWQRLA